MIVKSSLLLAGLLGLWLLEPAQTLAQPNPHWKKIGQLPDGKYGPVTPTCGHFWSKTRGVVATSDNIKSFDKAWAEIDGTNRIFYTVNGVDWLPAKLPHLSEHTKYILEILAIDDSNLFALIGQVASPPRVNQLWKSTDGGKTWMDSVVEKVTILCIYRSIDGQIRFGERFVPPQTYGLAWISDSIGVGGLSIEAPNWKTTDGGLSWFDVGYPVVGLPDLYAVLRPYYDRRSGWIFGAPHYQPTRGYGPVISTDSGLTWKKYGSWPSDKFGTFEVTGDIRGGRDAIYVQSAFRGGLYPGASYPESRGLCRTTNSGKTWTNIGGPSNYWTLDFNVVDCIGAMVIAYDSVGGIWMTEDGGDGSLSPFSRPILAETQKSAIANLCDSTTVLFKIENTHCDELIIESIEVIGDDPRILSTGALTLNYKPSGSTVLGEGGLDSISISWRPGFVWETDSSDRATIRVTYRSKAEGVLRDTVLYLNLASKRGRFGHKLSVGDISFDPTSVCGYRDTIIAIINTGCRAMSFKDALVSGSAYSIPSAPEDPIAPGDTAWVTVRFAPSTETSHSGILTLKWDEQGLSTQDIIYLSGLGGPGEGVLQLTSAARVQLPTAKLCAVSDTMGMLRNTGCDTVIVENVYLSGVNDYTLQSNVKDVMLPPDSTFTFRIVFTPKDKGSRNGTVTITWTDERGANPRDITISLSATVIDGDRAITSSLASLDFGETSICEERDSVVRFTNTGCDTLTITAADIDKNFDLDVDLPIVLSPNQSIELPISTQVDTTGKPTILTGLLTVTSNADNQLAPITLTRRLFYPTKLRIEAVDEANGMAGDETKFRILLEGDVPSRMTALHFDFLHNNDLLSFESIDGAGLSITRTQGEADQRQSFTLSPVHAGVLGELTFKAYLAEAEQTTLSFDNIRFDAEGISFAPECIAVIADSGSRFNYLYTCGNDLIRNALRGQTLVKSVTPNPATSEIVVSLESEPRDVSFCLVDVVGRVVFRQVLTRQVTILSIDHLVSGQYHMIVQDGERISVRSIVKL